MRNVSNVFRIIGLSVALVVCSPSGAADITLYASAIDTALKTEIFASDGKYLLSGEVKSCSYAYLERPSTSLRDGRIFVRMHFSGRAGIPNGATCVGPGEAFWLTVSGRPYFQGELVGITDFRLEEGQDVYGYGPLLEGFLASSVPKALNLNLRQEVMKILTSTATPYKVFLPRLELQKVVAENNALRVLFDFSLEGR